MAPSDPAGLRGTPSSRSSREPNDHERLWGAQEVAEFLGVPVATLYVWRHRRTGPRGRKIGRHLRYRPADVHAWVQEQE
ncbi:MAG TPA: helix-turn-helix domain-containing protein [Arthrobacter sp.]